MFPRAPISGAGRATRRLAPGDSIFQAASASRALPRSCFYYRARARKEEGYSPPRRETLREQKSKSRPESAEGAEAAEVWAIALERSARELAQPEELFTTSHGDTEPTKARQNQDPGSWRRARRGGLPRSGN